MACGMARAELKVCSVSLYTPEGDEAHSIELKYSSGETGYATAKFQRDAENRQGINWYWGSGKVKGQPMDLWLRVDATPTFLPIFPGNPPVAKLYYRKNAQEPWKLAPKTGEFKLNLPE